MEAIKKPRLLVVGGTGFIGQHIVQRGAEDGWDVTSISFNEPKEEHKIPNVNYVSFDLAERESFSRLLNKTYDYVINLGGYVDHTLFSGGGRRLVDTHFVGLLNLLEHINRGAVRRFIQIGSSDEYGDAPHPQAEDLRECPISPYSLAKVASTHFLQMLWRTEKFPAVIIRLFLTYGPFQEQQRFLPQIIYGCLDDLEFPVSAGEQLRDFCYVEDVVDAIFRCMETDAVSGQVVNIGSGEARSIRNMVETIVNLIGQGRPQFGAIPYRIGENMALYADITKAKELLNWRPKKSLDVGLSKTIAWYKACH